MRDLLLTSNWLLMAADCTTGYNRIPVVAAAGIVDGVVAADYNNMPVATAVDIDCIQELLLLPQH